MLAAWALLFGLYLLLSGSTALAEVVVGLFAASLAGLAAWVVRRQTGCTFAPRLRWVVHLRRIPGAVLSDCVLVGAVLLRALGTGRIVRGAFRVIPFDPGGDDPRSNGRRALVIASMSLAPNTYVVAIDYERRWMLLHQLVPSVEPPGRGDREWPL